jgi:hypothetical protein
MGALMTEQTGDYKNLLVTILYLVLLEVIKFLKAKNKDNKVVQASDKLKKINPFLNLIQKFTNGKNKS